MTIEELSEIFKKHHDEFVQREKELIEKFPDVIKSDFSIAEALHFICEEIIKQKPTRP